MLDAIEELASNPPNHAIPKLGDCMLPLSQKGSPNWEKGDRPVFRAAQAALLTIPGHAEYYRDKILNTREAVKEELKGIDTERRLGSLTHYSYKFSDFNNERMYGLQTLEHLPSAETVRVLGELLSDEWVSPIPIQGEKLDTPLCGSAVVVLERLPIANKPIKNPRDVPDAEKLESWRRWFQQIKDGKRTFRFEGDATEYDLNGPATEKKSLAVKRDGERTARHGKSMEDPLLAPSKAPFIASVLAAGTVIAALVWHFRSR